MNLNLPPALHALAKRLEAEGVVLYAVGGCVRDACLGRPVHDIDLTSRLKPDALIERAREVGIAAQIVQQTLGTVLLTVGSQTFEHTTFRTESYGAGGAHRPDAVAFADSPETDAYRRDFSINALYLSLATGEITDPTGGMQDFSRRVLRTTAADPAVILRDDGLRLNPGDPAIYREIAWMFLAKIGGDIDSAAPHYRTEWRKQVERAQDSGDWSALKFDPERMKAVDEEYGKQEWTHPLASALYWADCGLACAKRTEDRRELRQIAWQALMLLAKDDAAFAPRALAEMRAAYVETPSPMLRDLILRFRSKFGLQ